jgi:2-dehydropantoate 2-reductase
MQTQSYAIIGAGALGGFYGARLQQAGCEVHFLLRHDCERVRQHGWVIDSKDGDFKLPQVHAYAEVRDMPPCDVVAVALKSTQNHLLAQLLPPVLKKDGIVLVMQNGLGIEEEIARLVPGHRILGALCFIASNKIGPGHIHHLDYGQIKLAEHATDNRPRGVTEAMRRIGADFQRAGIPVELAADLRTARWQKLVWNIPYNGLSVVLNADTSELMANENSRLLVEEIMLEVAAAATACGSPFDHSFIKVMLATTDRMKPYRASMKIDCDLRRPMEIEAIYGNPLRAAAQAGVTALRIETLYRQLKFIDAQNRNG